ncbi:MAG: tetratricopeptide repeat protein [Deltaproteobacteria bacterium]|nr:tetratricopeptide repeat protein [Deltaproteobacteria bacterium]
MGPDKKKSAVDDLFDDLADSFFRDGDEGAAQWDELPSKLEIRTSDLTAEIAAAQAAPPPVPAPPVVPTPAVAPAPPAVAPGAAVEAPVAAPPEPAPAAPAPPPTAGITPTGAPLGAAFAPPSAARASSSLANEQTAIFTRPVAPAAPSAPVAPPPMIPVPAARPGDAGLFSAPTLIMPAAELEQDSGPVAPPAAISPPVAPALPPAPPAGAADDEPPPPAEVDEAPSAPVAAVAAGPGLPAPSLPRVVPGLDPNEEESLFMGAAGGADQAALDAELLDQPTAELPAPVSPPVALFSGAPPAPAPTVPVDALPAPEPAAAADDRGPARPDADDDEEATAEDFMDAGPDHSLVLRRTPRPAGRIDGAAPAAAPSAPAGDLAAYSADEIALARAERSARRAPSAALEDDWFMNDGPSAAVPAAAAPVSAPVAASPPEPVAAPPVAVAEAPVAPPVAPEPPAPMPSAEQTLAFGLPLSEADLGVFDEETAQMDLDEASALAGFDLRGSRTEDDALEAVEAQSDLVSGFAEVDDLRDIDAPELIDAAALPEAPPAPGPSAGADAELGEHDPVTEMAPSAAVAGLALGAAAAVAALGAAAPVRAGLRGLDEAESSVRATAVPSAGAAAWQDGAEGLVAEAAHRQGAEKATLLEGAGLIYFHRVADWTAAGALLATAAANGASSPRLLGAWTDVVAEQRDASLLLDLLERRAQQAAGPAAAELLQDAALVAQHASPAEARRLLLSSLDALAAHPAHPARWFGLQRLAALSRAAGADLDLNSALEQMIALSTGPRRARLLAEQAALLADRGEDAERLRSLWEEARAADPGAPEPLLALEAIARAVGDAEGLVALYLSEAARTGEEAWFVGRAVRAAVAGGLPGDQVAALWARARAAGAGPLLRREHQVWLEATGRFAELAEVLAADAEAEVGAARSWTLTRLGQAREGMGDIDGAIRAYQDAAVHDAGNAPAVEAAARLLGRAGRYAEVVGLLSARLEQFTDPNLIVHTLFRIGEINEGLLGAPAAARDAYERILGLAPGYLPALDGLERVLHRLGAWGPLSGLYEQRASLAEEPAVVAAWLTRAGGLAEDRLADPARALDLYRRALAEAADFGGALDGAVRLLSAAGEHRQVAALLRAAAGVSRDPNAVVSYLYRCARILVDQPGRSAADLAEANAALSRCVDLSPGFLPALTLRRDLAGELGSWADVYELHRLEADAIDDAERRAWRLLAAAATAEHLAGTGPIEVARALLRERAGWAPAVAFIDRQSLLDGDYGARAELLRADATDGPAGPTERWQVLAELSHRSGDERGAQDAVRHAAVQAVNAPHGLALLAAALRDPRTGANLAAAADPLLAARLLERAEASVDERVRAWAAAAEVDPVEAAAGQERSLDPRADRAALAEVHEKLAALVPDAAARGVHALLSGRLFEGLGDAARAMRLYSLAVALSPGPGKALDGLRRVATSVKDLGAIEAAHATLGAGPSPELALDLEAAGAHAAAAAVWRGLLGIDDEAGDLVVLTHLERNLAAADDWAGVFEVLGLRAQRSRSAEQRALLHQRRRWVLAEKLASTDMAWDHYRQLHAEQPGDPEVIEPLARIAAARGELSLSVQYLRELAAATADPAEAARLHRRVSEVLIAAGDRDGGRAALHDAMRLSPDDDATLAQLTEIAVADGDHRALAGLLARQATRASGAELLELVRRIARLWQNELAEPQVAVGAWRKVLELAPDDAEALDAVAGLSRAAGDWQGFYSAATARIPTLSGAARAELQAEVGRVCLQRLGREEDALRFFDAATTGDAPSLAAAQELERVYSAKGAWDRVVDAIVRQSRAEAADDRRVELLLRAAQVRLVNLMDRAGASELYGEVLKIAPRNATALTFRADFLYSAGDLAQAAAVFAEMEDAQRARDLDDFDDRIEVGLYYFRFAEALRALGGDAEAARRYGQALDLNPNHLPSLEAAGPLYMAAGRWEDAHKIYRQVLQLTGGQGDPERVARTYTNLGWVELHLGQLDKALKRFNTALEQRQNDIRALQGVSAVLMAQGNWNSLLTVYNNIIYHAQSQAEVVEAYLTKGWVLDARMSLPDKAAQHYRKCLTLDPEQPAARLRLAELALRGGDWAEAGALASQGLGRPATGAGGRAHLLLCRAVAQLGLGDRAAAAADYAEAIATDVTLLDRLPAELPAQEQVHGVLRERLHAAL